MKIIGTISAVGGIGNTIFSSISLEKIENSIFIDSNNGFRTIDLILEDDEIIYDLYDFSEGLSSEDVINKSKIDFIAASQSKSFLDFDFKKLKDRILDLNYDYILIDIPRDISYIDKYLDICDEFIIYTDDSNIALRNIDKISFMIMKKRLNKKINVVFNKVFKNIDLKEEKFKLIANPNLRYCCQIPFIYNFSMELDSKKQYSNFIEKIIKGEDFSFNELDFNKKVSKGIFRRIFNG